MAVQVGGQAVIDGVMMRCKDKVAVALSNPDGTIQVHHLPFQSWTQKWKLFRQPVIRGSFVLFETMILGMKALTLSAEKSGEGEEEQLSKWSIVTTVIISILLGIGLFIVLPLVLTEFVYNGDGVLFNVIDGVFRVMMIVGYIAAISLMSDMQSVFRYHGAEHKAVHCYEAKKELTVENVKTFPVEHPRCGTTFVFLVLVVSIIMFSVITNPSWFIKFGSRLLLLPVVAGISFELIKLAGTYSKNKVMLAIIYPGLLFQRLTTRTPGDREIEVAIKALEAVVDDAE